MQEQKTKQSTRTKVTDIDETDIDETNTDVTNAELAESTEDVLASIEDVLEDQDTEDLLADMDDILEENAAEFVKGFIQEGGQ